MGRKGQHIPQDLQAWIEARRRFRLTHAQVQMARELGLNPKKLGKLANHAQEPWKAPLPEFIEATYFKRFGRHKCADASSIEDRVRARAKAKELRRTLRAASRAEEAPTPKAASTPAADPKGLHGDAADEVQLPPRTCPFDLPSLQAEVEYIVTRAREQDPRMVTLGPLLLFSTVNEDAWLLDPGDRLALCLACGGEPLPFPCRETETSLAIDWSGTFELAGDEFVYADRNGAVRSMDGYPVAWIRRALEG